MASQFHSEIENRLEEGVKFSIHVRPNGETPTLGATFLMAVGEGLLSLLPVGGAIFGGIRGGIEGWWQQRKADSAPPQNDLKTQNLYPNMVLAVSQSKIALFQMKPGFFRDSIGEVVFQLPRDQMFQIELGPNRLRFASTLTIKFLNGQRYELEVHNAYKKKCQEVIGILNASG